MLSKESGGLCPPNPLGFFALGLLRQGPALGRWAAHRRPHLPFARLHRRSRCVLSRALSSIAASTSWAVSISLSITRSNCVSYWHGVWYRERALQALVTVVNLDVFEDLTPRLGSVGEDLIIRKTFCFERAEERFHRCIIITISYPAHALNGPDNTQRFAYGFATVLTASIGVKVQALIGMAQNQGIPERRNNQFCLQTLAQFPAHYSAAEQIQNHRQVKPSL